MTIDSLFYIHENALNLRAKRVELLASNIANVDTPGYKAKDIDFNEVFSALMTKDQTIKATHKNHYSDESNLVPAFQKERASKQPSLDGNTVDSQVESGLFAQNSIRYLTSLRFIDNQVRNMMAVLKGE